MVERTIMKLVEADLRRKMVFVGGPRQVGKTMLARAVLAHAPAGGRYFNLDDDDDDDDDRRAVLGRRWDQDEQLLVFDELHKYPRWKRWVKGIFDTQRDQHRILVTGSARLDVYRRGGDSLMGRYHYWRLHPLGVDERPQRMSPQDALRRLMTVGGFPEPFLDGDEQEARRWRRERFTRVLREDVRDLERIREIRLLELFTEALRQRVGSPVVLAHLAADLEIAPKTAKVWLELLERMYVVFTVYPLTRGLPRAIKKPPKVFFFDAGDVLGDDGARFENVVAAALLKRAHFLADAEGHDCRLHYVRDKEGHEVDFAVVRDGQLVELIEAKHADPEVAPSLRYFAERLHPQAVTQVVARLDRPYSQGKLRVVDACRYLAKLGRRAGPAPG